MKHKKIGGLIIALIMLSFIASATETTTSTQADFDEGIYNQTLYNTTDYFVQLNQSFNNGTYLSKVFVAGGSAQWNNISWVANNYGALPDNGQVETADYAANMSGNIALWHLDEGAVNGGTVYDNSSNGEHGTAYFSGAGTCSGVAGKLDGGCTFDGTTDYIDITMPIPSTVTISAWAKSSASSLVDMLWCINNGGTGGPDLFFYSGRISLNTWNGANNPFCNIPADVDEWHLYTTIIESGNTALYIDGELCGTANYANPSDSSIAIGSSNGYDWEGQIDEFAIWNRSLSQNEIRNQYRRGIVRLNLTARTCDDSNCDTEPWTDIGDTSPQTLSLDNNTYFQYKYYFETDNLSYSPRLYNATLNYNIIPSLDHYYVRTYEDNDLPRSHFANQSMARIKTNGTFTAAPTITILDSEGTTITNEIEMVNESNIFTYNYTLNGSQGWYDVTINSQEWKKVFYQAEIWQGNYTDEGGNPFVFRRKINVTEPGTNERFFEPVDLEVNFSYQPNNNSIRVLSYNGTDSLEIPSQIYNINQSAGDVYSVNLVFLSTINESETRDYYILSTKSASEKNYTTDLTYTNTSSLHTISNSYFVSFFNKSTGGFMHDIYDTIGTNLSMSGTNPMDYYPEFQIGLTTFTARSDNTVTANSIEGPLLYEFNVSGQANDDDLKPYWTTCRIYSKNLYMICEKNQSTTVTQNWKNFYLNGIILEDGAFTNVTYKNSTNDIVVRGLAEGDNSDTTGIDSDTRWIAFYDNSLGNAFAELFINRSFNVTSNPTIQIIDDSDYEYYLHNIIDVTSTSVPANGMFYTKTARMAYDGLHTHSIVDETYNNIQNPLTIVQSAEETSDAENPSYSNLGNISTNDQTNATCYSYWADDSFLDYAEINITGPGVNGSTTIWYYNTSYSIRSAGALVNESWLNITLNSSDVNYGQANCTVTMNDIASNSNTTSILFNLTDSTAPTFSTTLSSPNTTRELDPNVSISINSSITEYSGLGTVLLYYRPSTQSEWNSSTTENLSQTNYTYVYQGNFTPTEEAIFQYYVFANDTSGNAQNSSTAELNVTYDTTWHIISNLTTGSGVFDTNVSLGNITVNNTGDYNLSFTITAGVLGSRVYINETLANTESAFLVQNGSIIKLNINATTRPSGQTEGTDTITLSISNTTAYPTSNTTTVDIVTIAGGPFLYTTATSDNTTVYPGDTGVEITARVENLGNESATNTNLTFTLPTDWTTQYPLISELGTINVGAFNSYLISLEVPSDAAAGTYYVQSDSECSENKTGADSVAITVVDPNAGDETGTGTGGGGGGGGGGGAGLDEEESSRLFQSTEIFEITRGEGAEFTYILANPYDDATLETVNLELDGFTKDYIHFFPDHIRKLRINGSQNITVRITAPGYFARGEYELEFTITGDVVKVDGSDIIPLTYTKKILLYLREVSREDATEYKDLATSYLEEMQQANFHTEEIEILVASLLDNYNQSLFKEVKELFDQIKTIHHNAIESFEGLQAIKDQIELAEKKGIDVTESQRLYKLAQTAFERGDYSNSMERVNECLLTLAIETGGQYAREIMYSLKSNKKETAASTAGFIFFVIGTSMFTRSRMLKRKLRKLNEEQSLLVDLMKAIQIEVFEKAKMSMKEYGDAMTQYEERLNKVIEERIMFENKKENLYKFKTKSRKLKEERDKLVSRMGQAQHDYITKGKFETRVYENMLKSYSTRLSEVEEQIAVMDIKKVKK
jgi:hypothetical protein